ncbi:hypothetical protein, partial [Streptococcus pneumoniae]|uniref:hypothetical protein n=1 Tax=Streptococcus pneumoniae TaxID=1313 RepID=UPI002587D85C
RHQSHKANTRYGNLGGTSDQTFVPLGGMGVFFCSLNYHHCFEKDMSSFYRLPEREVTLKSS